MENQKIKELHVLFSEVVALFHRLKGVASEIHDEAGITAAMRGVLNQLASEGSDTVPRMARRRPVSRQHIQSVVNQLLDRGLIEYENNPDHRTSKLVKLTSLGLQVVQEMREREAAMLRRFHSSKGPESVKLTAQVLAEVRQWFEASEWKEPLNEKERQHD